MRQIRCVKMWLFTKEQNKSCRRDANHILIFVSVGFTFSFPIIPSVKHLTVSDRSRGYAFVIRNVYCVYMPARNRLALYVKSFNSGLVTIQLSFKRCQTEQYPSLNGPRGKEQWMEKVFLRCFTAESVLDAIMNITHPKPLK